VSGSSKEAANRRIVELEEKLKKQDKQMKSRILRDRTNTLPNPYHDDAAYLPSSPTKPTTDLKSISTSYSRRSFTRRRSSSGSQLNSPFTGEALVGVESIENS
jgi:hypothetical protein